MQKRRVLIVYRSYFPSQSHLGPATAIRNLVSNLSEIYDFHILTLNYDFETKQRLFPDPHHIEYLNNVVIEYIPRGFRAIRVLAKRLGEFDSIDIHCAFDPLLSAPAILLCKLGAAKRARVHHTPHGIFMDTIMSIRSLRKLLMCRLADVFGLYSRVTHLAGSASEKTDIQRRHRTSQTIHVTSQFIELPSRSLTSSSKPSNRLKIAFVGRIAPQKNLHYALEIVSKLHVPSTLDVFGDRGDPQYFKTCEDMRRSGTGLCKVTFMGRLEKTDLLDRLTQYDILLHPTLGENFGHAIVESLAIALPVLISDCAPWADIESYGAGWSLPLSQPDGFVTKLEEIYLMSDEWKKLSNSALVYVQRKCDRLETIARYRAAYG